MCLLTVVVKDSKMQISKLFYMYLRQHICSSVKFFTVLLCSTARVVFIVILSPNVIIKLFFPIVSSYCSSLHAPKSHSGFRKVSFPEGLWCCLVWGINLIGSQFFTVASSKCQ